MGVWQVVNKTRVSNPPWFDADPDPDQHFFLIADPDPDPGLFCEFDSNFLGNFF